jgi:ribosome-binding factor A
LTAVKMSRDLRLATVYFSEMPGSGDAREAEKHLNHAGGFLRRLLGKRVELRRIPELRFRFDSSIERGTTLTSLIDSLHAGDDTGTGKH